MHGIGVLKSNKNHYYSPKIKLEIINKVLVESQISISIEYGLSSAALLTNWIKLDKKNGYHIVEKKKATNPIDPTDKDAIIKT